MIDPVQEKFYNVRAAIPDHADYFARWADQSKAWQDRADLRRDVQYGVGANERLDLYLPGKSNAPVHMFIHGGYWQSRSKEEFAFVSEALCEMGALVVMAEYDLCPNVSLNTIVDQMRQALIWLHGHVAEFGGDPDQIHVSGHSAGGHLTAMMMATDWASMEEGLESDLVKSGISISGLFDLAPLCQTTINDAVKLDERNAVQLSPAFMQPISDSPFVLTVGGAESEGFHAQSDLIATNWGKEGVPVTRFNLDGCHHLSAVEQLSLPQTRIFTESCRLMNL